MFGEMCGFKIVLAFFVLLTAVYARPEGYGVKGAKTFGATANAAASAHAFGNTGFGNSAIAQSSATASADASAGGTANAAAEATANAFADGANIGKAISSASAIANANYPIGRSDVLGRPSHREKDTEYKATNHQDGTPACDQHIANAGHGGFVNNMNPTPGNIGGPTNSATVCHPGDLKCRNSKNDHTVPSSRPTYNEYPDLSSESSQPLPDHHGGRVDNTANSEHSPCAYGNPKCSTSHIPNPDRTHPGQADSEKPGLSQPLPKPNGGWGGNTANPGSRPCPAGSPTCSGGQPHVPNPNQPHDKHVESTADSGKPDTKPSVLNPYPSYNKHPDSFAGSSQPLPQPNGSWGGNTANPGSRPCTAGSPTCSGGQPHVPNPNQPHDQHVESTADSGKPDTKPSVLNPYPSYNKHPDSSPGSSQPAPNLHGVYGGHKPIKPPGEEDDVKGSHQHVPLNKNPDVLSGSSYRAPNFSGGCGGSSATTGSRPCTPGSSGSKPGTSNPFLNGEIDVSEIQKAVNSDKSSSESFGSKPNPSNPFLNPHSPYPSMANGASHSTVGNPDYIDTGSKPNPSNPFLNGHNQHRPTPTGSTHNSANPNNSDQGRPSSQYPGSQPSPVNPFLNNHNQHQPTPSGNTHHSGNPNDSVQKRPSDKYPGSKPNSPNPFLNPHNQHPSQSIGAHHLGNQYGGDKTGLSNQYPYNQRPSGPIPTHREHEEEEEEEDEEEEEEGEEEKEEEEEEEEEKEEEEDEEEEVKACSRGSCKDRGHNAENVNGNSDNDKFGNGKTASRPNDGVKTYRPGVKGGSSRRTQTSSPNKYHDSGHGSETSGDTNRPWDAYSNAHATASASAVTGGSTDGKNQAFSSANASGWSNSWASSSASASASASSSSWH